MKLISLIASINKNSDKFALMGSEGEYFPREIWCAVVSIMRHWCSIGVQKNQRVLLITDHDEQALFALAAASALGLQVVIPYSLQDTALEEWNNFFIQAKPAHVLYLRKNLYLAKKLKNIGINPLIYRVKKDKLDTNNDHILLYKNDEKLKNFLIMFSSGTTGNPKAIGISEYLICKRIISVSSYLSFNNDSNIFQSGLMNNTTGIIFSFGSLLHGSTLYYPNCRNINEWPSQCAHHGITHLMLRPLALQYFIDGMNNSAIRLPEMQVLAYGAAPMPRTLLQQGRKLIPCKWIQGYGLSETFGPFCWLNEEDHQHGMIAKESYCIGKPDNTTEIAIRKDNGKIINLVPDNEGEILLRGDGLMSGYFNSDLCSVNPVEGWFRTGDYACVGQNGELFLKGRISQSLITSNGHRVYPEEIESVISNIQGVREVVLIGWQDQEDLGDYPVACIHATPDEVKDDRFLKKILERIHSALSKEKWPVYLFLSDSPFPKNTNDKIVRRMVANSLEKQSLIPVNIAK